MRPLMLLLTVALVGLLSLPGLASHPLLGAAEGRVGDDYAALQFSFRIRRVLDFETDPRGVIDVKIRGERDVEGLAVKCLRPGISVLKITYLLPGSDEVHIMYITVHCFSVKGDD